MYTCIHTYVSSRHIHGRENRHGTHTHTHTHTRIHNRTVIPMPAHKQRKLFDYVNEAERTLHDLENLKPVSRAYRQHDSCLSDTCIRAYMHVHRCNKHMNTKQNMLI